LRPSLLVLFAAFAGHLAAQPAPVLADPTTGALYRPGAATFASYNNLLTLDGAAGSYLLISTAASTYLPITVAANYYQPLDADLTSWAAVVRAGGFDTFTATPSSANLASLVTGETGSGALVFGTSPTFTTPTLGAATATSITGATDLTLAGGSSGASLVLGQGTTAANATITPTGTGFAVISGPLVVGASSSAVQTAWTGVGYAGHIAFPDTSSFSVFSEPNTLYRGGGMLANSARVGGSWGFVDSTKPAWRVYFGNGALSDYFSIARSASTTYSESTLLQLTGTGNLLIGTTTDITGTGGLHVAGTTASTTTTSGALRVTGGVGVVGAINVGGAATFAGAVTAGGLVSITKNDSILSLTSATGTSANYATFNNTGGTHYIGTDSSAGGSFFSGASTAYSMVVTAQSGRDLFIGSGAKFIKMAHTTGDLTFPNGTATFAGAVTVAGTVIHTLSATPASASAAGTVGTMSWDANYIYICTATNTWKRVAIATW
jgi:hypothetical protein